jgi:hypothetical protein
MKKADNGKLVFEVVLNSSEALNLKGHTENVVLVSQNISGVPSRVSLRGKNEATKYFLIPKCLRKDPDLHSFHNDVSCQKISLPDSTMFVYVLSSRRSIPHSVT